MDYSPLGIVTYFDIVFIGISTYNDFFKQVRNVNSAAEFQFTAFSDQ